MSILSIKIIDGLIRNDVIKNEDRDIYLFGINQMFIISLNILTTLLIGMVFNVVFEMIIFSISYIALRSYAGGYHARNNLNCYIVSVLILLSAVGLIKSDFWDLTNIIICLFVSSIVIVRLAPIADINKPLDDVEKVVFKKKTLFILKMLIFFTGVSWLFSMKPSICATIAILTVAIMLIVSFVANNYKFIST